MMQSVVGASTSASSAAPSCVHEMHDHGGDVTRVSVLLLRTSVTTASPRSIDPSFWRHWSLVSLL